MTQPRHEQEQGWQECPWCGELSHTITACCTCGTVIEIPDRTSTGAKAHENGGAALDKCLAGEKPADFPKKTGMPATDRANGCEGIYIFLDDDEIDELRCGKD